ncbi:MAG: hypothetical protein J5737_05760 [Bacteroidales bacterium]|nr:hypothetical protein [Bacteroidales bacterium]
MKRLFAFILALTAFSACIDQDPFLYRIVTFGFPQEDGSLLADDGIRYILNSTATDFDWARLPRVIAVLDVTEAVSDSTYKARLQQYTTPVYKEPVVVSEGELPDTLGTDDILVSDVWYSGGCLNMMNVIELQQNDTGGHMISLVADCREESPDTLKFEIHHKSNQAYTPADMLSDYSFYSSFPVKSLMPKRDSVIIKVSWTWNGEPASASGKIKL